MTQEGVTLLAGTRQKSESYKAVQGCNDFLRMGPGRSLAGLYRQYRETQGNTTPTRSKATIEDWSHRYGWTQRAEAYDRALEDEKNARAAQIMSEGLAQAHERVVKLRDLAGFLETQLYEQGEDGVYHNVWVPDVKQIGGGEFAERVDIEHFNAAIISEFRATLDDLAKETGGRVNKSEITGKDGEAIVFREIGGVDLANDV